MFGPISCGRWTSPSKPSVYNPFFTRPWLFQQRALLWEWNALPQAIILVQRGEEKWTKITFLYFFYSFFFINFIWRLLSSSNVLDHIVQMKSYIYLNTRKKEESGFFLCDNFEGAQERYVLFRIRINFPWRVNFIQLREEFGSQRNNLVPRQGNENKFKKSTEENTSLTSAVNSRCYFPFVSVSTIIENWGGCHSSTMHSC